jgi:hypothetical protein
LPTYRIAECPFDGYVWRVKGHGTPKSCPRDKKRFDTPWNDKQPKIYPKSFKNPDELREFLEEQNRKRQ